LRDVLLPKLLGVTIPVVDDDPLAGIRGLREEWSTFRGFEFSKASVEQALCDLAAQMKKISLQTLFGGTRKTIDVGESLGIKPTISATLEEVDLRLQQGFKRIKLKIKPGHDQGLVDAVRKAHPDIPLMVDANSAYTLSDVVLFKSFDQQNLMMIEQPLSYDDILDHAALAKEIKTPICLDESILCLRHARQAVELGAAGIINIKPSRVGGPLESMAIHDLCLRKKIPVWCGGMFETGIGRAFNIALASLEGFTLPADMSPSSLLFTYDLVSDPFEVVKGEIAVRTTPGLGFTPDQDAIKRATIHTDVVAA
jgi:O-succinylbenzoate synthase